jgi:hypothetical protein
MTSRYYFSPAAENYFFVGVFAAVTVGLPASPAPASRAAWYLDWSDVAHSEE